MKYQYYDPNPVRTGAGDCVVRAICKAENKDWGTIYMDLSVEGMALGELPNANMVWDRAWAIVDDLVATLWAVNKPLYNALMRQIKA